jgi:hypothetical protein
MNASPVKVLNLSDAVQLEEKVTKPYTPRKLTSANTFTPKPMTPRTSGLMQSPRGFGTSSPRFSESKPQSPEIAYANNLSYRKKYVPSSASFKSTFDRFYTKKQDAPLIYNYDPVIKPFKSNTLSTSFNSTQSRFK